MIGTLFEDGELTKFLDENQHNNWEGTKFEQYPFLSTKNKGCFGEALLEKYMHLVLGYEVKNPTNTGHDRIMSGWKTEIKFSLANSPMVNRKSSVHFGRKLIKPDEFTFNHIATKKDWDRLIFFGVNPLPSNQNMLWECKEHLPPPPQLRGFYMTRDDFAHYMDNENMITKVFAHQQGGDKSDNDDYMVAGYRKFQKLINLPFVKPIEEWSK